MYILFIKLWLFLKNMKQILVATADCVTVFRRHNSAVYYSTVLYSSMTQFLIWNDNQCISVLSYSPKVTKILWFLMSLNVDYTIMYFTSNVLCTWLSVIFSTTVTVMKTITFASFFLLRLFWLFFEVHVVGRWLGLRYICRLQYYCRRFWCLLEVPYLFWVGLL